MFKSLRRHFSILKERFPRPSKEKGNEILEERILIRGLPDDKGNKEKEKPPAPPKERELEEAKTGLNIRVKRILQEVHGIATKLEEHDKKTDQGFADLSRASGKLLQQFQQLFPTVPTATRETLRAFSNISESHKRLINELFAQEMPENQLTYEELSEKLGMKESSVRGIIHDLRQIGFEFTTGRVGKRVAIGLSKDLLQQLLVERN